MDYFNGVSAKPNVIVVENIRYFFLANFQNPYSIEIRIRKKECISILKARPLYSWVYRL